MRSVTFSRSRFLCIYDTLCPQLACTRQQKSRRDEKSFRQGQRSLQDKVRGGIPREWIQDREIMPAAHVANSLRSFCAHCDEVVAAQRPLDRLPQESNLNVRVSKEAAECGLSPAQRRRRWVRARGRLGRTRLETKISASPRRRGFQVGTRLSSDSRQMTCDAERCARVCKGWRGGVVNTGCLVVGKGRVCGERARAPQRRRGRTGLRWCAQPSVLTVRFRALTFLMKISRKVLLPTLCTCRVHRVAKVDYVRCRQHCKCSMRGSAISACLPVHDVAPT